MVDKKSSLPTRHQFSAGGVVYRRHSGTIQYLLGLHSGYHKWVLPKGIIETDETPDQTAIREIAEETGINAKITKDQPLHQIEFWFAAVDKDNRSANPQDPQTLKTYQEQPKFKDVPDSQKIRIHKTVTYFLCEYVDGNTDNHSWEMTQAKWFPYSQALKKLSFRGEKDTLTLANELLSGKQ